MAQAQILNVSYDVFKTIAQNNSFTVYFHPDDDIEEVEQGNAFAGTSEYIYSTRIVDETWLDFDATFPTGTRVLVARGDDAVATVIGLSSVPITHRTPDGRLVLSPSFEDTGGLNPKWEGKLYTAPAGALSFFDEVVVTEKQLRGGWYELIDDAGAVGDYVEQSVIDKDDVLGYFALYGMTVGVDVLELKKYIKTEYVNPVNAGQRQIFTVSSTFTLVAGLYLRVAYNSVGTNDVQLKVTTLAYE